ncbi:hypothetical protein F5890DRAFT_1513663 [Lentinula detonsa]|uniref:F-box domain-containing protein n=1 Tax=Lentinula detonsa TaxID=2804962 RepID=A0AA38Q135_9AGAR|nr:hypothetical protein F5890DRAFT_1513663 [Lentinula detonsa]
MTKACDEASSQPPSKKRKALDESAETAETETTKTKKAGSCSKQAGSSGVRRTQSRAKLSMLPSLNLDILLEIFSHLFPIDLLHLARTTKALRNLLMRRNTSTVWKYAFTQIQGLPECPSDVSFPAWAHLAFEPVCHNCYTSNVRNISWILRTRLCSRCAKICLEDAEIFDAKNNIDKDILECVPFNDKYCRKCCLASDRKRFVQELKAHREGRQKFVEQKMAEVAARFDHALLCEDWSKALANEREIALQQIKDNRHNAISEKLLQLGYGKVLDFLSDERADDVKHSEYVPFHKHHLVRHPRNLTDKIWDSIKDDLEDYMQKVRAYIERKERKELIWKRRERAALAWNEYRNAECEPGSFLPNQIDIWVWDPVRDIIERPSEAEVTKDSFEQVFRGLPSFIESWQRDKITQIVHNATDTLKWISFPGISDLELATCVFTCSNNFFHSLMRCYEDDQSCLMWFPEFVYHQCNTLTRRRYGENDEELQDLDSCELLSARSEALGFRRRQWSARWLFFDDKASRTVRSILTACGMSQSAKVQQLDQEDPRLICLKCSFGAKCDGERSFSVMTWRTAVQHNVKKHFGDGQTKFQRISSLDVDEAKRLETAEQVRRLSANPNHPQRPVDKLWRCTLCRDCSVEPGALTLAEMQKHQSRRHNRLKENLEEGVDYYRAYDRPPPQPYPVKIKPRDPTVDL